MDIVNWVQGQEKKAEEHCTKRVVNSKGVVQEYLEKPEGLEAKKKFSDYKSEQWKGISQMEWFEGEWDEFKESVWITREISEKQSWNFKSGL